MLSRSRYKVLAKNVFIERLRCHETPVGMLVGPLRVVCRAFRNGKVIASAALQYRRHNDLDPVEPYQEASSPPTKLTWLENCDVHSCMCYTGTLGTSSVKQPPASVQLHHDSNCMDMERSSLHLQTDMIHPHFPTKPDVFFFLFLQYTEYTGHDTSHIGGCVLSNNCCVGSLRKDLPRILKPSQ